MTDMYSRHRRKTPSFSSSLLDSILRSIDESNDGPLHDHNHNHNHELRSCDSEPKRSNSIHVPRTHLINEEKQMPNLPRAIMIDQWMETQSKHKKPNANYVSSNSSSKFSSDSSNNGTETPSTYRSLPNSFTISRKAAEAVFLDDTQKACSTKVEGKFMKSTKLKAFKIYGDMKKVRQPTSPGSRISAFILSLFASSSSSSKKAKHEESMQNLRSIKQDTTTKTCASFSRSCMSKKQPSGDVKRSVRFYPVNETVILDQKSIDDEGDLNSMAFPKYERRRFTEKKFKNFMVNNEDDDEDDLFELENVGGVGTRAYGQELPVFETTDLRKIRI